MDEMSAKLTERAMAALAGAAQAAAELKAPFIGTEHLLLGLAGITDSVAAKVLMEQGINSEQIHEKVVELSPPTDDSGDGSLDYTPRTKRVLEFAQQEALRLGSGYIGTEHLLLGLVKEGDGVAITVLAQLNVNGQRLCNDIYAMIGEPGKADAKQLPGMEVFANILSGFNSNTPKKNSNSLTPTLDHFSRDYTAEAANGKFDPVIGRDNEIERIIQILSRRTKNNPCLVGDPGVGKTAIVEGLATKIIKGLVPETMKNKRVVALDLSAMVAGSKYRGEFEERIKRVMSEVKNHTNNVILFIDELHTLIGAGGAEGALDASNILKPALSRGEMQVIGATTLREYRRYIEKDGALERRFQPITVPEPTLDEAVAMLMGLRDRYEAHHNVKITDKAIEAAVKLSARYINDRFLPDKAVDLLDEAASKVRLKTYTTPDHINVLQNKLNRLEKEKEEAIKGEEFEKAGVLKQEQSKIKKTLKAADMKWKSENELSANTVDAEEIADAAAMWTGIPVKKLQQEETKRLINMEETLHKRVIGQDEAVSGVSRAIRRGRVGFKNPKRPIGSFLFLGPTGVGKTELSKAISNVLFGTDDAIIRVDMSEYMEKHSVSKLIGSPPGYIGYDEGGQLSEKVRRKPYSVILFDEIEKAHPDVFNILLQVLDDGHITDAHGRRIDFKNTVIIMTSNAGARDIISPKKLGFKQGADEERDYETMKKSVMDEVKQVFRPEFINRIDDIIVFHALSRDNVRSIIKLMLEETTNRVEQTMNMKVNVTDAVIDSVCDTDFDPLYGARPLRRAIQTKIEDKLAELTLAGKFKEGDIVAVDMTDGEIMFS